MEPIVSVVVVTHNRRNKIVRLLSSLGNMSSQGFIEVIAVDDASIDGTSEEVSLRYPNVRIGRTAEEVFLARARNMGANCSRGKYILFVDDDMVIEIDSIRRILAFLETHPNYGIAGPAVAYFKNGRIWHAGVLFRPSSFTENLYIRNRSLLSGLKREGFLNCCYVPGIFMVRKRIFQELQGFDFRNFPFSYEDIDLALRAQSRGYKIGCVLSALALHDIDEISVERSMEPARAFHHGRSRTRFYVKHLKWKLFWLPVYLIGFMLAELSKAKMSPKKSLQVAISYLRGIVYGVLGR